MKPTKLFCLLLVLTFIAGGYSKKPTKSLHQAAYDGDIRQIKLHISRGVSIDTRNEKGDNSREKKPELSLAFIE